MAGIINSLLNRPDQGLNSTNGGQDSTIICDVLVGWCLVRRTLCFEIRFCINHVLHSMTLCHLHKCNIVTVDYDFDCTLSPEKNAGLMNNIGSEMTE